MERERVFIVSRPSGFVLEQHFDDDGGRQQDAMQGHARRGRSVFVTLVLVARGTFLHLEFRRRVQCNTIVFLFAQLAATFHPKFLRLVCC